MSATITTIAALAAALAHPGIHVPRCTVEVATQTVSLGRARDIVWELYQRVDKVDRQCKDGKCVDEYFPWKDIAAAKRLGVTIKEFVIDKVEARFVINFARMALAMEKDGVFVGVTGGFRDSYRQSITTGNRSGTYSSYHGSRPELGSGRGLALDVVAYDPEHDRERQIRQNLVVWAWIDKHGNEFGIGRPYGKGDYPHVAPTYSREWAGKQWPRSYADASPSGKNKKGTNGKKPKPREKQGRVMQAQVHTPQSDQHANQ